MYDYTKKTTELFSLLQDDLSKRVFWARLRYNIEPSMTNLMELICSNTESGKIGGGVKTGRVNCNPCEPKERKLSCTGLPRVGKSRRVDFNMKA